MTNTRPSRTFRLPAALRLVVIAPHPDDETLGCGLLIAHASRKGARVAVVALTDGQASHPGSRRWPAAALGRLRRSELRRAMARLGARRAALRSMGWCDGRLHQVRSALRLRAMLHALRADVVVAASPSDNHPDHRAGWRLAVAATTGTGMPLLPYAVWSRLDAAPRGRARDPGTAAKNWAMRAYRSQIGDYIMDDPDGFRFAAEPLKRLLSEAETLKSRYLWPCADRLLLGTDRGKAAIRRAADWGQESAQTRGLDKVSVESLETSLYSSVADTKPMPQKFDHAKKNTTVR